MAKAKEAPRGAAAAKRIDALIARTDDWRGQRLAEVRRLILDAVDGVEETWKWMGSPVWEKDGIIAVGDAHKSKVKLTFPHGAQLADPNEVFNNGLGGKSWRSIDLFEDSELDVAAFQQLVRAAAEYNAAHSTSR
ncbi:DUF1801 domain-containing protein [uncultured Jatrophihabitans sp.]|uniref:DUF1801 domain-containing protein n=1 Tax=uncultured Jatrophihabitans sp. TaxID=1610747 RepID=UPI0035CABF27